MNQSSDLYDRLLAFSIDDGNPELSFEARLARENGWPVAFARRVVREYRRFLFLAVTAGHPVTPSEQVDQAWHLHLTYSRSYWERLCGGLLGRPLHHGPTRGGAEESAKFHHQYRRTLTAYRAAFGEDAPTDVWPPVEERFGADLHFVRVNTARNWVVPKAAVGRAAVCGLIAAVALACGMGCGGAANPFDLAGLHFVWFLAPLLVSALALGLVLWSKLRGPGPQPEDHDAVLDWADVAYLAGGRHRLTTAAIARLVAAGAARVSSDGKWLESVAPGCEPAGLSPVEGVVLRSLPVKRDARAELTEITRSVSDTFTERAEALRESGYLLSTGRMLGAACAAVLPLAAVVLFLALPRLVVGLLTAKPMGVLIAVVLLATLIGVAVFVLSLNWLSHRGRYVLKRLRASADRDPTRLADPESVGLAVALFGTAVLVGCEFVPLIGLWAWYPHQTTTIAASGGWSACGVGCGGGGGDGGGGGGCGGGGCGGGGCGGCGG